MWHKNRLINPEYAPSLFRLLTSLIRVYPAFLIIGAQKCGTSSLYEYLIRHPCVRPPFTKEVHFFDNNYSMGINWYKANFPTFFQKYSLKIKKLNFMTGESGPSYLYHPRSPKRVSKTIPKVKSIVILRNPVDRAYSNYQMVVKMGHETLSFEEAIKSEKKRLQGEKEKILENENYSFLNYGLYSYLHRGIYVDQIKEWLKFFPKEQLLVLKTEDLKNNQSKILKKVCAFLSIPNYKLNEDLKYNVQKYKEMKKETRGHLVEFFKPHNERLCKYLNRNFDWNF